MRRTRTEARNTSRSMSGFPGERNRTAAGSARRNGLCPKPADRHSHHVTRRSCNPRLLACETSCSCRRRSGDGMRDSDTAGRVPATVGTRCRRDPGMAYATKLLRRCGPGPACWLRRQGQRKTSQACRTLLRACVVVSVWTESPPGPGEVEVCRETGGYGLFCCWYWLVPGLGRQVSARRSWRLRRGRVCRSS